MMKIDECFVGQKQATIDNIKGYVENYPLSIIGFNVVASMLVNFLDIQSNNNFKFNVDITRHNSYWYFDVDSRYYPPEDLKATIDKYLKDNKLDSYIEYRKTVTKDFYVLTTKVE